MDRPLGVTSLELGNIRLYPPKPLISRSACLLNISSAITLRREIEGKIGQETLLSAIMTPDENSGIDYDTDPPNIPLSTTVSTVTNQPQLGKAFPNNVSVVAADQLDQNPDSHFFPTDYTENMCAYDTLSGEV
jgi:hypothetical protein